MDTNPPKTATILIVDNDLSVCKLFEVFLEIEGYKPIIATSGAIALEMAKSNDIDLILLDVMMPEMDGFEVCSRLQADPAQKKVPIIFVTAKDDTESYIRGFELGAIDYLNKPINRLELTVKIRNYLNLSWNEARLKESELRYKSIVEDQTELIIRFLPDGTISFVNNAFCNYVNKRSEELLGISLHSKPIQSPLSYILPELESLTKANPVRSGRRRIIFSEGRTSWLEWVDRALFDGTDQLIEYQCVGRDITVQKKYEDVIHLVADETSGIIGELFFDVLLTNIAKILNVDYAILGRFSNRNNAVINTFSACKNGFIIDDFELSFENTVFKDQISKEILLYQGEENSDENEVITVLGEEVRSFASVPLFDKNQDAIGVLVILTKKALQLPDLVIDLIKIFSIRAATELERSISDKKIQESEKKFKNIFQSSADSIVITNFEHEIIEANETFHKRFGLNGEKAYLIGFMHHNDKAKYESSFVELLQSEKVYNPIEIKMLNPKLEIRIYEIISKVIEYQGDKSVLSILRDITERKEMQLQILNTIIDTEEKERKRFSQDLHDGLGPMLSTIKLYINQLEDKDLKKKARIDMIHQSTEMIDEAIATAKDISNNLMPSVIRDFGLIAAIETFCQKINVVELIDVYFDPNVTSKGFNKTVEIVLYRIVKELINNTIKYAQAQHINITLNERNNKLQMLYEDDGIGFDVQAVINSRNKGMGLNNIITRAKSVNGTCMMKSVLGQGLSVIIDINF